MRRVLVPLLCAVLSAVACARDDEPSTEALRREGNQAVQAENWDAATTAFRKLTELDPQDGDAWHMLGFVLHSGGKIDEALPAHLKASEFPDVAPTAAYNAACAYARKGDKDKAIEWLQKAVGFGFARPEVAEVDSDLASLRGDPRFQALIDDLKRQVGGAAAAGGAD
jgi:Flp pilus assembly protein TadD